MAQLARRQQGASLVEVLVAIGILTIAILAFIRLYPSGFLSIKRTGQIDSATRLAQRELERLKLRQDNLPYVIAPVRFENVNGRILIQVDPTVSPEDMGVQPNLPNGIDPDYAKGLNRTRRVLGERVALGQPGFIIGTNQRTDGIFYTTAFAPIAVPPDDVDDATFNQYLFVYGNPMPRIELEAGDFRDIRVYEYGIDYEAGAVLLRPLRSRPISYKIDYSYIINNGGNLEARQVSTIIRLQPTGNQPPFPVWVPLTIPVAGEVPENFQPVNQVLGFSGIVPDSDLCARLFERVGIDDGWDPDYPYQYKVLNPLLGTVAFNPAASNFFEEFWRGRRALVANLDYIVHDWSIIREDITLSGSGARLTFTDIKQFGDLQDDQTTYQGIGLLGERGNSPVTADMVLIDLTTGATIYIRQGQQIRAEAMGIEDPNEYTLPNGALSVDYGSGFLRVNDLNLQNRKFRVLYKVNENWSLGVQKAAHRYFVSPVLEGMPVDACWYNPFEPSTRIYFNRSEAGKTVLLREFWYRVGNANRQGTNGVFRISETPDATGYVYIDLRELYPNAERFAPEVTGVAVRGIQGLSLRVRMTYEPSARPIRIDFDTLLTRRD